MQPGVDPYSQPETQYVAPQQYVHAEMQYAQPAMPQQQIVYIDLKYKPEVNLRNWSYLALGIGIAVFFGFFALMVTNNSEIFYALGSTFCCFSFAIAGFMDAAFYKGKADWQLSTGQSNGGSITGMVFDIIFGILCVAYAIFMIVLGSGGMRF